MTSHQLAKILLDKKDLPIVFIDGDNKQINFNTKGEVVEWDRIDVVDNVSEIVVRYDYGGLDFETAEYLILQTVLYSEAF